MLWVTWLCSLKIDCCVRLDVGERAVASNICDGIGSLKSLQNLQPMERRRLADIFPTGKAQLNTLFGDEPSPLHFRFQAASSLRQPETKFSGAKNGLGSRACLFKARTVGLLGVGMAAQRHENGLCSARLGQPEKCSLKMIVQPPVMDRLVISPTFLLCK